MIVAAEELWAGDSFRMWGTWYLLQALPTCPRPGAWVGKTSSGDLQIGYGANGEFHTYISKVFRPSVGVVFSREGE